MTRPRMAQAYVASVCFCVLSKMSHECPHCPEPMSTPRHRDRCHLRDDERMKRELESDHS